MLSQLRLDLNTLIVKWFLTVLFKSALYKKKYARSFRTFLPTHVVTVDGCFACALAFDHLHFVVVCDFQR